MTVERLHRSLPSSGTSSVGISPRCGCGVSAQRDTFSEAGFGTGVRTHRVPVCVPAGSVTPPSRTSGARTTAHRSAISRR
ncbi:hypothetical protein RAJCM14343_2041 [Rhodococcus aetherivorans]|uniref:Uncharacterized protein n=1 Tax=Rhodococcus aetherivorans TaxID=191292 RepID=A0ABQ0YJX4_9NOCA|nr:hypothetical protein RAJCM14343_2041 [Rhodococcus aetherivorans]